MFLRFLGVWVDRDGCRGLKGCLWLVCNLGGGDGVVRCGWGSVGALDGVRGRRQGGVLQPCGSDWV